MTKTSFSVLSGFFLQDDLATRPLGVSVPPSLGLVDTSPDRWNRLKSRIAGLQEDDTGAKYKVIFFGRHGQGHHNVAEAKYGTKAWDDYWAKLETDGEIVWGPDPALTSLGEAQAEDVNREWKKQVPDGVPLPEKFYSSPLRRALRTNQITFEGVSERSVLVVERVREQFADHTCDKRRAKSLIAAEFPEPKFLFEEGFSEEDVLYTGDKRTGETKADVAARAGSVLDRIFRDDPETFISITAHNSIINGFLESLGVQRYDIPTGGVLPLVVKGVVVD